MTIDLAPVHRDRQAEPGLTRVHPGEQAAGRSTHTLALFSAKDLVKAQTLYRLINDLKIVLPILSLLLIALGVYIARGHRRALIGAGLGFAASMLVLALAPGRSPAPST